MSLPACITTTPRYQIRESTVDEIARAENLLREYFEESISDEALRSAGINPDLDRYHALENSGELFALAAHHNDGIVGYSINIVIPHHRSSSLIVSVNDLIFVSKRHRNGGPGLALIRATEKMAKNRGAMTIMWCAKPTSPIIPILESMKYGMGDMIFSKVI
ncbi:N-acetyltransferase domain-containing protein [Gammaproteobacteria bacterium]